MTNVGPTNEGSNKPPCRREDALAVLTRLREAGHVAYFAGGCVRDELLGLTPKDYDIATDASPDRVRQLFTNTQAVGAAFGVILVRHKKSVLEVATFRTDGKYLDGRRPQAVTFTTAEEDAKRRDFTINGLFLDPIEIRVIDYVGGQEDLKNKVLRAIGDPNHRFEEDHLRLMRAVRFAARFGLQIEHKTQTALRHHAPELARISPERVGEEMRLLLTPTTRNIAWDILSTSGLADVVYRFHPPSPEKDGIRVSRFGEIFDKVAPGEPIPIGLSLAAATLDRAWPAWPDSKGFRALFDRRAVADTVRALRRSLKLSNDESDQLSGTLIGTGELLADEMPSVAKLKRALAQPTAALTRQLLDALKDILDSQRIDQLLKQLSELEVTDFSPTPLVTGDDLTDAGLKPGRAFKIALEQTYDAQLEGRVTTRKEALEMSIEIAKRAAG